MRRMDGERRDDNLGLGFLWVFLLRFTGRRFWYKTTNRENIGVCEGDVRDARNLLTDDFSDCRIGLPDCTETFLRPELADRVASVTLQIGPEVH